MTAPRPSQVDGELDFWRALDASRRPSIEQDAPVDELCIDIGDPSFVAAAAELLPGVVNLAALSPAARARIVEASR